MNQYKTLASIMKTLWQKAVQKSELPRRAAWPGRSPFALRLSDALPESDRREFLALLEQCLGDFRVTARSPSGWPAGFGFDYDAFMEKACGETIVYGGYVPAGEGERWRGYEWFLHAQHICAVLAPDIEAANDDRERPGERVWRALEAAHALWFLWGWDTEGKRIKHPLIPLIRATLTHETHIKVTASRPGATKVHNEVKTAVMTEHLVPAHVQMVPVEGVPMASLYRPQPGVGLVEKRGKWRQGELPLPGARDAANLLFQVFNDNLFVPADLRRRGIVIADTTRLVLISTALTHPVTLPIVRIGAYLRSLPGECAIAHIALQRQVTQRAWNAIGIGNMQIWIEGADGRHPLRILNIIPRDRLDFWSDIEIHPLYGSLSTLPAEPGWRLTSALTMAPKRDQGGHIFSRFLMGVEDYLEADAKLRAPEDARRKILAGRAVAVSYNRLLAKAGLLTGNSGTDRKRWKRLATTLKELGYVVPGTGDALLRAEAPAHDSIEVLGFMPGSRGRPGMAVVRMSARGVAARQKAVAPRRGGWETIELPGLWTEPDLDATQMNW